MFKQNTYRHFPVLLGLALILLLGFAAVASAAPPPESPRDNLPITLT